MTNETKLRSMPVTEIALDGDGRTLETLLVPWDVTARIVEEEHGKVIDYREGFRTGTFDRQIGLAGKERAAWGEASTTRVPGTFGRVNFKDQHAGGYGKLGMLAHMENVSVGLYGRLRIHSRNVGTVRESLEDGIDNLSIEFVPIGQHVSRPNAEGIVWRSAAVLTGVALEAAGAYAGAKVLQMRSANEDAERIAAEVASEFNDLDAYLAAEAGRWDHLS